MIWSEPSSWIRLHKPISITSYRPRILSFRAYEKKENSLFLKWIYKPPSFYSNITKFIIAYQASNSDMIFTVNHFIFTYCIA